MATIKYIKNASEFNKITVEFETNPDTVTINRHWIGYMDIPYSNHVVLTEHEAKRLYQILREKFEDAHMA